jgi:hypothetical protein
VNSALEKIPLQEFHRHVIITQLKGQADRELEKLEIQAQSGVPLGNLLAECVKLHNPAELHFQDDEWYATEILLAECYCAHANFRPDRIMSPEDTHLADFPKDERYVDFMPERREAIDRGSFPCASAIRTPWRGQMWEPFVRERQPGKYYVLDGQLRIIWHWYHNVLKVKVFMYRGQIAA